MRLFRTRTNTNRSDTETNRMGLSASRLTGQNARGLTRTSCLRFSEPSEGGLESPALDWKPNLLY